MRSTYVRTTYPESTPDLVSDKPFLGLLLAFDPFCCSFDGALVLSGQCTYTSHSSSPFPLSLLLLLRGRFVVVVGGGHHPRPHQRERERERSRGWSARPTHSLSCGAASASGASFPVWGGEGPCGNKCCLGVSAAKTLVVQ